MLHQSTFCPLFLFEMRVAAGTLKWAFPAHFFFGLQNFLIDYINSEPLDTYAAVGGLWLSCGCIGFVTAAYFASTKKAFFWSEQEPLMGKPKQHISMFVKVVTIVGGLNVGFSQLMMKESYKLAPSLAGPLCAVISSDVIVISTVCHFYFKEYLTMKQAGCVFTIVSGMGVMAICSSSGQSQVNNGVQERPVLAFFLAFLGMLSFAMAILAIRVGCTGGVSTWSGFSVRMVCLLVIGIAAEVHSIRTVGWPPLDVMLWVAPCAAGLLQAAGVLCVNKALEYPNTGVANAIFASNSVDVLILNIIVFGLYPNKGTTLGMLIVIGAVASISLVDSDSDPVDSPKELPTPSGRFKMQQNMYASPHVLISTPHALSFPPPADAE